MHLNFVLYDFPCRHGLQSGGDADVSDDGNHQRISDSVFWKRGMEMRPAHEMTMNKVEHRLIPAFPGEAEREDAGSLRMVV